MKIRIEDKAWNFLILTIILEAFAKFGRYRPTFIRKRVQSIVKNENYLNIRTCNDDDDEL